MATIQKIRPCLWFDREAEDAAKHYVAIIPGSSLGGVTRYGKGMPLPEGTALTVEFELAGQRFVALNGGPMFKFTEAISLMVDCDDQVEVDTLWERLSDGGSKSRCGWLKDKYGLSWQIVPSAMQRMIKSGNAAGSGRMMQAMMGMTKLDIAALQAAFDGR